MTKTKAPTLITNHTAPHLYSIVTSSALYSTGCPQKWAIIHYEKPTKERFDFQNASQPTGLLAASWGVV